MEYHDNNGSYPIKHADGKTVYMYSNLDRYNLRHPFGVHLKRMLYWFAADDIWPRPYGWKNRKLDFIKDNTHRRSFYYAHAAIISEIRRTNNINYWASMPNITWLLHIIENNTFPIQYLTHLVQIAHGTIEYFVGDDASARIAVKITWPADPEDAQYQCGFTCY